MQVPYLNAINKIVIQTTLDTTSLIGDLDLPNFYLTIRKTSIAGLTIAPAYFGANNFMLGDAQGHGLEMFVDNSDFLDCVTIDSSEHPKQSIRYEASMCVMNLVASVSHKSLLDKILSPFADRVRITIQRSLEQTDKNDLILFTLKAIESLVNFDYEYETQQMKYFYGEEEIMKLVEKQAGNSNKQVASTALRIGDQVDLLARNLDQDFSMQGHYDI